MGKLEDIQTLIYELNKDERSRLREWFDEYDGDSWDTQFGKDVEAKKIHPMGENAKKSFNDGKFKDI